MYPQIERGLFHLERHGGVCRRPRGRLHVENRSFGSGERSCLRRQFCRNINSSANFKSLSLFKSAYQRKWKLLCGTVCARISGQLRLDHRDVIVKYYVTNRYYMKRPNIPAQAPIWDLIPVYQILNHILAQRLYETNSFLSHTGSRRSQPMLARHQRTSENIKPHSHVTAFSSLLPYIDSQRYPFHDSTHEHLGLCTLNCHRIEHTEWLHTPIIRELCHRFLLYRLEYIASTMITVQIHRKLIIVILS